MHVSQREHDPLEVNWSSWILSSIEWKSYYPHHSIVVRVGYNVSINDFEMYLCYHCSQDFFFYLLDHQMIVKRYKWKSQREEMHRARYGNENGPFMPSPQISMSSSIWKLHQDLIGASTAHLCPDYKNHLFMWQTLFGTYLLHTLGWVCLCLWKVLWCRGR